MSNEKKDLNEKELKEVSGGMVTTMVDFATAGNPTTSKTMVSHSTTSKTYAKRNIFVRILSRLKKNSSKSAKQALAAEVITGKDSNQSNLYA